jgi:hypothetical protein
MRWCLRLKLAQHARRFGDLLRRSAPHATVERSRKDRFWGATPGPDGMLRGENQLGRLLMGLREELQAGGAAELVRAEPPAVADFLLLGQEIGTLAGTDAR